MPKQLSIAAQQSLLDLKKSLNQFKTTFNQLSTEAPAYHKYKKTIDAIHKACSNIEALDLVEAIPDSTPSNNAPLSQHSLQQIGDPKTIKPEYKGVNFDYEANAKKIRYYEANLTDGGHFEGLENKIEGIVLLHKQTTNQAITSISTTSPTSQEINEWNQRVDKDLSDVNTVKSGWSWTTYRINTSVAYFSLNYNTINCIT